MICDLLRVFVSGGISAAHHGRGAVTYCPYELLHADR